MPPFRYQRGDRPLEGFTIEHAVGRGGFGEVYYALSDAGRQVAIKALQHGQEIELRGIAHCMNLKSPHLVSIFDVRQNDHDEWFVIMEYVAGPSLRQIIDESPGGLGAAKSAYFLREIAKGLSELHDCGIVHRDLKPHNIFFENGYVKIGDYSLSKCISASQHSNHTMAVGTVHYMAPEIGRGSYDRSVDIYALGVVLYEMLTGQVPYVGATPGEVLMKHMTGQIDTSHIEEPFASAIKRAMTLDPAERFKDVQEMVESVFGAEHVSQSVSGFRPATLTQAGQRAFAKVTIPPATPHVPVTPPPPIAPPPPPQAPNPGLPSLRSEQRDATIRASDAQIDPIDGTRRAFLAFSTIGITAFACAILHAGEHMVYHAVVLLATLAATAAVIYALYHRWPTIALRRAPFLRRIPVRIAAATVLLVVTWLGYRFEQHLWNGATLFVQVAGVLLVAWWHMMLPIRDQRVSWGMPVILALTGAIAAAILGGSPALAGGFLAGLSLALQVASPWTPRGRNRASGEPNSASPLHSAPGQTAASSPRIAAPPPPVSGHAPHSFQNEAPSQLVALALALVGFVIPVAGLHRFYVGKIGTGIIWLVTWGFFGLGQLVDAIVIAVGQFRDVHGRLLTTGVPKLPSLRSGGDASAADARHVAPDPAHVVLSVAAALIVVATLALGLALALDLPEAVAAGVFAPAVSDADMQALLGHPTWPRLAHRLGFALLLVCVLFSLLLVTLARVRHGLLHVARGWAGLLSIIFALWFLGVAFTGDWNQMMTLWQSNQFGVALEMFLNSFREIGLILACALSMPALLLFFWPARRELERGSVLQTGVR